MKKFFALLILVGAVSFVPVAAQQANTATPAANKPAGGSSTKKIDKTEFIESKGTEFKADVRVPTADAGLARPRKVTDLTADKGKSVLTKLKTSNKLLY